VGTTEIKPANFLDEGAKQACYLSGLLRELGFGQEGPMALYNDNQSAIALATRSVGGKLGHSRRLEIKIHALPELVASKIITIWYHPTNGMPADRLAKNLGSVKFKEHQQVLLNLKMDLAQGEC